MLYISGVGGGATLRFTGRAGGGVISDLILAGLKTLFLSNAL